MIIYKLPILYNKKKIWSIWLSKENNKLYMHIKNNIISLKKNKNNQKKAIIEINRLWKKKKENGYIENKMIIKPMGAHKLNNFYYKIIYPAYVQKKLDGFRCISNIDKKAVLYSKNMKPFIYLNHIKKELMKIKELVDNPNIYLDGELYENNINLHQISSLVMKKYASKNNEKKMKKISYYIFDLFDINNLNNHFYNRYKYLKNIFIQYKFKYIKLVECYNVSSYKEIQNYYDKFILDGYEGIIVRNKYGLYELNKKSYNVLRTKEFKKKDFIIVGAKEGTGIQKGAIIWKLQCLLTKKTFWAVPLGTIDIRKKIYKLFKKEPKSYVGHYAKVKYIKLNNNGCVIRNPVVYNII
jgi:ATP-dependent DNA ligase